MTVRGSTTRPSRRDVGSDRTEEALESEGHGHAEAQTQDGADEPHDERLRDERSQDLATGRAEGTKQSEFAAALGHEHGEGVQDDERSDEEGDAGEDEQEDVDEGQALR